MPPAATKPPAPRKRNRKRKRRAASSSSSSSSSSSESSDSSDNEAPVKKVVQTAKIAQESSSSSSESSSSSSSSSSDEDEPTTAKVSAPGRQEEKNAVPKPARRMSPSPSPPPTELPSFLPPKDASEGSTLQEQQLKDRFRQFWMASMADGFRDDLEAIRKEPNLGPSRLALLIDSLAAGADVFSSSTTGLNEMEVVLE